MYVFNISVKVLLGIYSPCYLGFFCEGGIYLLDTYFSDMYKILCISLDVSK